MLNLIRIMRVTWIRGDQSQYMHYICEWSVAYVEGEDAICSSEVKQMETEYMALFFGTCEIIGLNMTATKLEYENQKPILAFEDN